MAGVHRRVATLTGRAISYNPRSMQQDGRLTGLARIVATTYAVCFQGTREAIGYVPVRQRHDIGFIIYSSGYSQKSDQHVGVVIMLSARMHLEFAVTEVVCPAMHAFEEGR